MADLVFNESSQPVQIVGGDEIYAADVVLEKGFKKLYVKATAAPQVLGNLAFVTAKHGANESLSVNGSVTPVEFTIPTFIDFDYVISSLTIECFAGNVRFDRFLDLNAELANGILIEVRSEGEVFQFLPIKRTGELDSLFSVGEASNFNIVAASSGTFISAKFGPASPFILKKQGTYLTDDYIKFIVRDNLSSIQRIRAISFGAKDL
jgi:hypothetical protein